MPKYIVTIRKVELWSIKIDAESQLEAGEKALRGWLLEDPEDPEVQRAIEHADVRTVDDVDSEIVDIKEAKG